MAPWYKLFLLIWLVTWLPIMLLGYGFSGGSVKLPDPRYAGVIDIAIFVIGGLAILSPIWLAPFGIRWRK